MTDYSQQDFLRAISLARSDGNTEAVGKLRKAFAEWQRQQDEIANDPTAGMGMGQKVAANFGAGIDTVWEGLKQTLGLTSSEDIRAKEARDARLAASQPLGTLTQGIGTAAALAPLALIPGANTVPGAALVGGLGGLAMPTTDDDVIAGKALNTALGTAGGAAVQGGLNAVGKYAPRAYNSALDAWARRGLPGSAGRQQQIAERSFVSALDDPAAARVRLMQFGEEVPGVRTSTGAALGDQKLLAVERAARETAGEASRVLRDQEVKNNAARWAYAQGMGGDAEAVRRAASDSFEAAASRLKPKGYIDPQGKLVAKLDDLIERQVSDTAASELTRLRNGLAKAMMANDGRGDMGLIHKVRMELIDDVLDKLASSDRKGAGNLRKLLANPKDGFKKQLDDELNRATSGRWSRLLNQYATDITPAGQLENANALLAKMGERQTTVTGEPLVSSSVAALRKAAGNQVDDFGTPLFTPKDSSTIGTLLSDVERQMSPFKVGVSPRGSATMANASERGLMDLLRPPSHMNVTDPVAMGIGAATTGDVTGAIAGLAANRARGAFNARADAASMNVSARIGQLLADQAEAYKLLERLNPVVRAQVEQTLMKRKIPLSPGAVLGAIASVNGMQALAPAQ